MKRMRGEGGIEVFASGIVSVLKAIKNVQHREISDRQDDPLSAPLACQLMESRIHRLSFFC